MRLDHYLAKTMPEHSRSLWQKYISLGYISVDENVVTHGSHDVSDDTQIDVALPDTSDRKEINLPIIYEDDNVIVINKPVGILTHSKGALNDEFTIADFFRPRTSYNLETNRPGIVHRLDRHTSGILIGAKNDVAARLLSKQFQDRRAKKTYYAILRGTPKQPEANIDLPIGRNPKIPSTFRVDASGKSAQTHYRVIESNDTYSLVELKPLTGRTHQLRVHMAYIGTPIVGDELYGSSAERLYLHAASLEITIPGTPKNERKTFESPIPNNFEIGGKK